MADFAWDIDVPSSLERLLLVCLEDHCADERFVPFKFAALQRLTGMSQNRIKQAVNTLWAMGRLEYRPSRGGHPQQFHILSGIVVTATGDPPFPKIAFTYVDNGGTGNTYTPSKPSTGPDREVATDLVKEWFATTSPRPTPAGGFPAAVKIVETILAAGWTAEQTGTALGTVPTLSLATMEYALRRQSPAVTSQSQSTTAPPKGPIQCGHCGGYGNIRSPQGLRCISCGELWEA